MKPLKLLLNNSPSAYFISLSALQHNWVINSESHSKRNQFSTPLVPLALKHAQAGLRNEWHGTSRKRVARCQTVRHCDVVVDVDAGSAAAAYAGKRFRYVRFEILLGSVQVERFLTFVQRISAAVCNSHLRREFRENPTAIFGSNTRCTNIESPFGEFVFYLKTHSPNRAKKCYKVPAFTRLNIYTSNIFIFKTHSSAKEKCFMQYKVNCTKLNIKIHLSV